jgi:hypothetical protein
MQVDFFIPIEFFLLQDDDVGFRKPRPSFQIGVGQPKPALRFSDDIREIVFQWDSHARVIYINIFPGQLEIS